MQSLKHEILLHEMTHAKHACLWLCGAVIWWAHNSWSHALSIGQKQKDKEIKKNYRFSLFPLFHFWCFHAKFFVANENHFNKEWLWHTSKLASMQISLNSANTDFHLAFIWLLLHAKDFIWTSLLNVCEEVIKWRIWETPPRKIYCTKCHLG